MRKIFAVINTWPGMKNAEYEVLQRIVAAGRNIGAECVVVDNNGLPLWWTENAFFERNVPISSSQVDFVLSLHFESPRVVDAYSYLTLWQPLEFYHTFGYQKSIDKVQSHDDFLSCASDTADSHARNLLVASHRALEQPFLNMFHAPAQPFLVPNITETSRLFYIGINWERLGKPKGRFHDALTWLDGRDLVDIHGPEEFLGVAPWAGFESYAGEIAFDGRSTMRAINRSGICLALSSTAHKNAGIMSNRLFEGFAGGAAVIATPNPFIDKFFKGLVYEVDDSGSETALARRIEEVVAEIRADPKGATERVIAAQEKLTTAFSLESSLQSMIDETPTRKQISREMNSSFCDATVLVTHRSQSATALLQRIEELAKQENAALDVIVFADHSVLMALAHSDKYISGAIKSLKTVGISINPISSSMDGATARKAKTGAAIANALAGIETEYFAFVSDCCHVFSDHFARLARAISITEGSVAAYSSVIEQTTDALGAIKRVIGDTTVSNFRDILQADQDQYDGRFLYSKKVLDAHPDFAPLFDLLDGQENLVFKIEALLTGPLATSSRFTFVNHRDPAIFLPEAAEPKAHQQQYIRDFFSNDPRWHRENARSTGSAERIYAYSPGAPVRWENYHSPYNEVVVLVPSRNYRFGSGGEGWKYLGAGFSFPEPDGVWIEGPAAVMTFSMNASAWPEEDDYELCLLVEGRNTSLTGKQQSVALTINGALIGYQGVSHEPSWVKFRIPPYFKRGLPTFKIELHPSHAEMAYNSEGVVVDGRRMSIKLKEMSVEKVRVAGTLPVVPGQIYSFGRNGNGISLVREGFQRADNGELYISNGLGILGLQLSTSHYAYRVAIEVKYESGDDEVSSRWLSVTVTGKLVAWFELLGGIDTLEFEIPGDLSLGAVEVGLNLAPTEAGQHVLLDTASSSRVFLRMLKVVVDSSWPSAEIKDLERLPVDDLLDIGQISNSVILNSHEFSQSEGDVVWLDGDVGRLCLYPPADPEDGFLWLTAKGRNAMKTDRPQSLTLSLDGYNWNETEIGESFEDIVFAMPKIDREDPKEIKIRLRHAEQVVDGETVVDGRRLGLQIGKIGWVSQGFVERRLSADLKVKKVKLVSKLVGKNDAT